MNLLHWLSAHANATSTPAQTIALIDGVVDDLVEVLFGGLGLFFAVIGALIGLFFIVRLIMKYISGAKG